jgi:predicted CoA-binding protein
MEHSLDVDHIIPLNPKDQSVCGLHCWANLQILDKSLNLIKGSKYQTDW